MIHLYRLLAELQENADTDSIFFLPPTRQLNESH